jgi:hypothetical protein
MITTFSAQFALIETRNWEIPTFPRCLLTGAPCKPLDVFCSPSEYWGSELRAPAVSLRLRFGLCCWCCGKFGCGIGPFVNLFLAASGLAYLANMIIVEWAQKNPLTQFRAPPVTCVDPECPALLVCLRWRRVPISFWKDLQLSEKH